MVRKARYIAVVILTIMLMQTSIFAQPIVGKISYTLDQDISLKGTYGTYEWFFYVEEPWEIKDAQVAIEYLPTQLATQPRSTLTVAINNTPFYSQEITQPLRAGSLKVAIPKESIKPGYNKITLKGYVRLSEEPCTDSVNPATWLNVLKESKIFLSYKEKETVALNQFPYPLIGSTQDEGIDIIIPKDYTDGELEAALWLSSVLGSYKQSTHLSHIKTSDSIQNKTSKNVILVGSQQDIQKTYPKVSLPDDQTSVIFLDRTEKRNTLVVCGDTEKSLERAAKLLINKELIKQIDSDYYMLKQDIPVDTLETQGIKNTLSLKELGYEPIYMTGQHRNQTSVFTDLPNETVLQRGAKLVLKAKYAKNINFNRSLVTLYIDEQPVASSRLSEERADEDQIELYIDPKVTMRKGSRVTIAFDLELDKNICIAREEDTPWVLIEESSYFYLPQGKVKGYSFNTFPYPFVTDNRLQDIGVIIPDELKNADLKILGSVFEQTGGAIKSNQGSIKIIRQGQTTQLDKKRHLIIYGTPKDNAFIAMVNKIAHMQLNKTEEYFTSNKYINVLPEYGKTLSVWEIKPSLANEALGMLTIIAPNQKVLDKMSENRIVLPNDLGQVMTIDEKGIGEAIYIGEEDIVTESSTEKGREQKDQNKETFGSTKEGKLIILVIGSMLGIGILAVILLVYLKNRKN